MARKPKDPRGRPFRLFSALVEYDGAHHVVNAIRAHDAEHAQSLMMKRRSRFVAERIGTTYSRRYDIVAIFNGGTVELAT